MILSLLIASIFAKRFLEPRLLSAASLPPSHFVYFLSLSVNPLFVISPKFEVHNVKETNKQNSDTNRMKSNVQEKIPNRIVNHHEKLHTVQQSTYKRTPSFFCTKCWWHTKHSKYMEGKEVAPSYHSTSERRQQATHGSQFKPFKSNELCSAVLYSGRFTKLTISACCMVREKLGASSAQCTHIEWDRKWQMWRRNVQCARCTAILLFSCFNSLFWFIPEIQFTICLF